MEFLPVNYAALAQHFHHQAVAGRAGSGDHSCGCAIVELLRYLPESTGGNGGVLVVGLAYFCALRVEQSGAHLRPPAACVGSFCSSVCTCSVADWGLMFS